jgi:pimeloyl-ACP methyl ester carboxylesterase
MAYLGRFYRTYALDFWGFGESGKKQPSYSVDDYVSMVNQFMEQLGIARAPLVGHSMGGTVSLKFAIDHPERVSKVVVIGSPVDGKSLALLLKLAGIRSIAFLVYNNMWGLKLGLRVAAPFITRDRRWTEMINADLSKVTLESFLTSIASLRRTDLTQDLARVQVGVMGIYGTRDNIVHPNQWKPICEQVGLPTILRFNGAGHFPMLDDPERFRTSLRDFLNGWRGPEDE